MTEKRFADLAHPRIIELESLPDFGVRWLMPNSFIKIDGADYFLESLESGWFCAGSFPEIGKSVPELVNRLRAAGHVVAAEPADDGGIDTWYVFATNPTYPNGEDVWFFLSHEDAESGIARLKARHSHLVSWRVEKHRLFPESYQTISTGGNAGQFAS